MIKQGQIILHGDHDLSNYSEVYGFNDLFNYFVGIVQEIYRNHGVNINSKHIDDGFKTNDQHSKYIQSR